jgi:hypothetical protein
METAMRKPRDFDVELKTLEDKARTLKERKVKQLGELVIATGADALDVETLAGGLLGLAEGEAARKAEWRNRGAAFFRSGKAEPARSAGGDQ